MDIPGDIRARLLQALYWIDSIGGWGFFDGASFSDLDGEPIELTWDDISTLGSCLGL